VYTRRQIYIPTKRLVGLTCVAVIWRCLPPISQMDDVSLRYYPRSSTSSCRHIHRQLSPSFLILDCVMQLSSHPDDADKAMHNRSTLCYAVSSGQSGQRSLLLRIDGCGIRRAGANSDTATCMGQGRITQIVPETNWSALAYLHLHLFQKKENNLATDSRCEPLHMLACMCALTVLQAPVGLKESYSRICRS
jgi:hypothetical protein